MKRSTLLGVLLSIASFGQGQTARLEFEVASIKPSPPLTEQVRVGVHVDGVQVHCSYLSLKDYLRAAYRMKDYQITGPEWIASERFDISAKLPEGSSREQVPEMLKNLLADRFEIKTHQESKEFPVYALTVAKSGLRIKSNPPDPDAGPANLSDPKKGVVNVTATGGRGGTSVNLPNGGSFTFGDNRFIARKMTMAQVAESLARFEDKPVIDMTQAEGTFDFTLEFTPEDYQVMLIRSAVGAGVALPPQALKLLEVPSGDSVITSLQTLGLKLETRKAPLDVLVIDHAAKTPTAN